MKSIEAYDYCNNTFNYQVHPSFQGLKISAELAKGPILDYWTF